MTDRRANIDREIALCERELRMLGAHIGGWGVDAANIVALPDTEPAQERTIKTADDVFCNGWDDDQVLVDKLITSWENVCRFSVARGATSKIGHNADTRARLNERIRRAIRDIETNTARNGARFSLVSFAPEDIVWLAFSDDIRTETTFVIQGRRHALFDEWWQEIRNQADYDYFMENHEESLAGDSSFEYFEYVWAQGRELRAKRELEISLRAIRSELCKQPNGEFSVDDIEAFSDEIVGSFRAAAGTNVLPEDVSQLSSGSNAYVTLPYGNTYYDVRVQRDILTKLGKMTDTQPTTSFAELLLWTVPGYYKALKMTPSKMSPDQLQQLRHALFMEWWDPIRDGFTYGLFLEKLRQYVDTFSDAVNVDVKLELWEVMRRREFVWLTNVIKRADRDVISYQPGFNKDIALSDGVRELMNWIGAYTKQLAPAYA